MAEHPERAASTLVRLERIALMATHALTIIGFACLLALALATVADIVGRGAFGRPVHGVSDLAAVIMAVIVSAALPACFAERRNIGVDLLGQALGKGGRLALDLLGHVASLAFLAIFAWQLARYAGEMTQSGQTTWVLRLPLYPWWWAAAVIVALTVPTQMLVIARQVAALAAHVSGQERGA